VLYYRFENFFELGFAFRRFHRFWHRTRIANGSAAGLLRATTRTPDW